MAISESTPNSLIGGLAIDFVGLIEHGGYNFHNQSRD